MLLLDAIAAGVCLSVLARLSKEPMCGAQGFIMVFAILGFLGAVVEVFWRLGIIR